MYKLCGCHAELSQAWANRHNDPWNNIELMWLIIVCGTWNADLGVYLDRLTRTHTKACFPATETAWPPHSLLVEGDASSTNVEIKESQGVTSLQARLSLAVKQVWQRKNSTLILWRAFNGEFKIRHPCVLCVFDRVVLVYAEISCIGYYCSGFVVFVVSVVKL